MSYHGRPELGDVKIGDEVFLIYRHGDAKRKLARIEKVARVWLTVAPVNPWFRNVRIRRDSQSEGTGNSYELRMVTPEQLRWDERQREAEKFLSDRGIRLDLDSPWRRRRQELADVIRAAESGDRS